MLVCVLQVDQFRSFREIVAGLSLVVALEPDVASKQEFRVVVLRASPSGRMVDERWINACLDKQERASKALTKLKHARSTTVGDLDAAEATAAAADQAVGDALSFITSDALLDQRMRARLELVKQAARGLMEIHEFAGIAHRQLDPRNITLVSSFFVTTKHSKLPKLPPEADCARLLKSNFMGSTGGPNRDEMPPPHKVRLVYDNFEYGRMLREQSETYWRKKEQTGDFPIQHALLQHWFGRLNDLKYKTSTAWFPLICSTDVNTTDAKTQDMFGLFLSIWQILAAVSFESQWQLEDGELELHELLADHFIRWCTAVRSTRSDQCDCRMIVRLTLSFFLSSLSVLVLSCRS